MRIFPSSAIDIVRINFTFESGNYYQPIPLVSAMALSLFCTASHSHTARQVDEFIDYRGIVIERSKDMYTCDLTLYVLRKYADETLHLLHELFVDPYFSDEDYNLLKIKNRQEIEMQAYKADTLVYKAFTTHLMGESHPKVRYATVDDVDRLSPDIVMLFMRQHFGVGKAYITMAGACDESLQQLVVQLFGDLEWQQHPHFSCAIPRSVDATLPPLPHRVVVPMAEAKAQSSIYVGKILQLLHADPDFYHFAVLNCLLGGYFGSRLVSNIREDKGYTYAINSFSARTRNINVLFIKTQVRCDAVDDTLRQIRIELQRLIDEPVSAAELDMVRAQMRGDLISSRDGVFELSEISVQQCSVGLLHDNYSRYLDAIDTTTPQRLQAIAERFFQPDSMYWFSGGEKVEQK